MTAGNISNGFGVDYDERRRVLWCPISTFFVDALEQPRAAAERRYRRKLHRGANFVRMFCFFYV